jgi:hypothetical protein
MDRKVGPVDGNVFHVVEERFSADAFDRFHARLEGRSLSAGGQQKNQKEPSGPYRGHALTNLSFA